MARRYGPRWALSGLTLDLPAATAVMLAGKNGAGKSTLLRILATAIKPDRGTASIDGFDVVRDREDVRKITALLAHQTYLYESLTARENLAVVADHLRRPRTRVGPALEQVGLASRADDPVAEFSAGMRKRLSFARLLLQEPRLALLDEPYGALDPPGFDLVDEVIASLRRGGATVVMATHHWERAAHICDSAVVLDEGRLIWQGAAADSLAHEPRWAS